MKLCQLALMLSLFLLYSNPMSVSVLSGLELMSDISTLPFFKHWHTLRPFPAHWNLAGTPGVIKNECQQAKHLQDSSLRTSGYELSRLCNLELFVPNSCCLSFFSAMHWRALYHPYVIFFFSNTEQKYSSNSSALSFVLLWVPHCHPHLEHLI